MGRELALVEMNPLMLSLLRSELASRSSYDLQQVSEIVGILEENQSRAIRDLRGVARSGANVTVSYRIKLET